MGELMSRIIVTAEEAERWDDYIDGVRIGAALGSTPLPFVVSRPVEPQPERRNNDLQAVEHRWLWRGKFYKTDADLHAAIHAAILAAAWQEMGNDGEPRDGERVEVWENTWRESSVQASVLVGPATLASARVVEEKRTVEGTFAGYRFSTEWTLTEAEA